MNVVEKSKLHADRRELGTKKHHITLLYTKIVQRFKHFQSCNSNKDQNDFYKGMMGTQLKTWTYLSSPNHRCRCIIHPIPPNSCMHYQAGTPIIPLNYYPGLFNYLTYKPFHLTF